MNKKIKIFLSLIVLSITPFFRGCDDINLNAFSFGFPFPIIKYFFGSVTYTGRHSWFRIEDYSLHIFFTVLNILIAYIIAKNIVSKEKYISWMPPFFNALIINLCITWSIFVIYIGKPPLLEGYSYFVSIYMLWVPLFINSNFKIEIPLEILTRVWFMTATFLLTGLLYTLSRLKNKYFKKLI